jgi:hypothetical protein
MEYWTSVDKEDELKCPHITKTSQSKYFLFWLLTILESILSYTYSQVQTRFFFFFFQFFYCNVNGKHFQEKYSIKWWHIYGQCPFFSSFLLVCGNLFRFLSLKLLFGKRIQTMMNLFFLRICSHVQYILPLFSFVATVQKFATQKTILRDETKLHVIYGLNFIQIIV